MMPLALKLGIREGSSVVILHPRANLDFDVPRSESVHRRIRAHCDLAVAFYLRRALLESRLDALGTMILPSGGLWIAWPKRSSRVATDITDHAMRDLAPPRGLVDNIVCAINETWAGLRLVWRREARPPQG
jgi:hypothetical protein